MRSIIVMFVLGLALAVGATAASAGERPGGDRGMAELFVENAEKPTDHEALARYYRERAAEKREMAEHHRRMQRSYAKPGKKTWMKQRQHCQRLVDLYESAATEYESLARLHDEEAR